MTPATTHRSLVVTALVGLVLGTGSGSAVADGWSAGPSSGPEPRIEHTMVFDEARGVVVLFSGDVAGQGFPNDVWEFDGTTWSAGVDAPVQMTPRHEHAMSYDAARSLCVVFGGRDANLATLDDTWEFDGATWTQAGAPPAALTPRRGMVMTYDPSRSVTVMYGGQDAASSDYDETWEYDGGGWSAGAPTPAGLDGRIGHAMAFDPGTSTVVLFGGLDDALVFHADLWQYDGSAWTARPAPAAALTPRATAMVWDPSRDGLLLFGGFGTAGLLGDTWLLDASGAKELAAVPGPSARTAHAMAYDAVREDVVLFGGTDLKASMGDTWISTAPATGNYLVGAGSAFPSPNQVRVYDRQGSVRTDFLAYGSNQWGTNVAAGQIAADDIDEILTAPGPGGVYGPHVRGWLRDGVPLAKVSFFAYGTLRFGARVAAGDTDRDGWDEILTSPGPGAVFGPHIRGFNNDGASPAPIGGINFFAYGTLKFGADVSASDLEADGYDEILTAPGPSPQFGPQIRGWDVDGGPTRPIGKVNFLAFDPPQQYGAFVAGGDVDGDRYGEILCARGAGPNQTRQFRGFTYDAAQVTLLPGFDVTPYPGFGGGRIGAGDVGAGAREELLASPSPDPATPALVTSFTYDGTTLTVLGQILGSGMYGANPAGGAFGY